MAYTTEVRGDARTDVRADYDRQPVTHSTETRRSFVTTEFWAMLAAVAAIIIAGYTDEAFNVDHAWTLVAAVVTGYLLSRGIAKAGSPERYIRGD